MDNLLLVFNGLVICEWIIKFSQDPETIRKAKEILCTTEEDIEEYCKTHPNMARTARKDLKYYKENQITFEEAINILVAKEIGKIVPYTVLGISLIILNKEFPIGSSRQIIRAPPSKDLRIARMANSFFPFIRNAVFFKNKKDGKTQNIVNFRIPAQTVFSNEESEYMFTKDFIAIIVVQDGKEYSKVFSERDPKSIITGIPLIPPNSIFAGEIVTPPLDTLFDHRLWQSSQTPHQSEDPKNSQETPHFDGWH
jgi:hypothetical protein